MKVAPGLRAGQGLKRLVHVDPVRAGDVAPGLQIRGADAAEIDASEDEANRERLY